MNTPSTICERLIGALRGIVEFCDDPDGSEKSETLACGLSRLLPNARDALAEYAALPPPSPVARDEVKPERSVNDIPDADLLRRAVRNVRDGIRKRPRWVHVMEVFALGSTYSAQLCRRFGLDPDEVV